MGSEQLSMLVASTSRHAKAQFGLYMDIPYPIRPWALRPVDTIDETEANSKQANASIITLELDMLTV